MVILRSTKQQFLEQCRKMALVYQYSIYSSSFETSRKELLHDFCKLMKNEVDMLVWVWCHNTDLTWQTSFMLWPMFFTTHTRFTINVTIRPQIVPDIRFLTLLRQCWCIISIVKSNHNIKSKKTLWIGYCNFNVALTFLRQHPW